MLPLFLMGLVVCVNGKPPDDALLQQHAQIMDSVGFGNLSMDTQRSELETRSGNPGCKTVNVNTGCVTSATTLTVNDISSYDCPAQVDNSNWLSTDTYDDRFEITVNGDSVTVTRTDGGGSGWCMHLSFECCKDCDPLNCDKNCHCDPLNASNGANKILCNTGAFTSRSSIIMLSSRWCRACYQQYGRGQCAADEDCTGTKSERSGIDGKNKAQLCSKKRVEWTLVSENTQCLGAKDEKELQPNAEIQDCADECHGVSWMFLFNKVLNTCHCETTAAAEGSCTEKNIEKYDLYKYGNEGTCTAWRQTGKCDGDGPREPSSDKDCTTTIEDVWSGYCECMDGSRMMKKGCELGAYLKCNDACLSGNYVVKPANQVCASNEIIDNLNDCKSASSQLNLKFAAIFARDDYPYGCFRRVGDYMSYWNIGWNSPLTNPSESDDANAICKTGQCLCKALISSTGNGNYHSHCQTTSEHFNNLPFCYVVQPSFCTDLLDSLDLPGEKMSAEACTHHSSIILGPCTAWRQTGNCDGDGPREPSGDKGCERTIADAWSGYCECTDGNRMMKKRCEHGAYLTCNDACLSALVMDTYAGWCRDEGDLGDIFSGSDENTFEECKQKCYGSIPCTAFSYETPTHRSFFNCKIFQGGPYTTGSGRPNTNCYIPERKTRYFLKQYNELCLPNEMIADVDECKLAISQLREDGSWIDFQGTIPYSNWPAGCFLHTGSDANNPNRLVVRWNTNKSGRAEKDSKPICKM